MSEEMKKNAPELSSEEAKKENFAAKKELTDDELEHAAGGEVTFSDGWGDGFHTCWHLTDVELFKTYYHGNTGCPGYVHEHPAEYNVPEAPSCLVCLYYSGTIAG